MSREHEGCRPWDAATSELRMAWVARELELDRHWLSSWPYALVFVALLVACCRLLPVRVVGLALAIQFVWLVTTAVLLALIYNRGVLRLIEQDPSGYAMNHAPWQTWAFARYYAPDNYYNRLHSPVGVAGIVGILGLLSALLGLGGNALVLCALLASPCGSVAAAADTAVWHAVGRPRLGALVGEDVESVFRAAGMKRYGWRGWRKA